YGASYRTNSDGTLGGATGGPPRPRPVCGAVPGGKSLIYVGISFDTTYNVPFVGSIAELPQLAPPLWPGISIDPFRLRGVKGPSFREFRNSSRTLACSSSERKGLMSFSVNDCRANGGGAVGKGCVGDVFSPGASVCGTGRSSIGHSGAPVTRSKTYKNPCL